MTEPTPTTWYVEEGDIGWHLNESVSDASDGWLATFGHAQEAQAKQAAREHNAHADLVAALKEIAERDPSNASEIAYAALAKTGA